MSHAATNETNAAKRGARAPGDDPHAIKGRADPDRLDERCQIAFELDANPCINNANIN
jgi:hypothetical protein